MNSGYSVLPGPGAPGVSFVSHSPDFTKNPWSLFSEGKPLVVIYCSTGSTQLATTGDEMARLCPAFRVPTSLQALVVPT